MHGEESKHLGKMHGARRENLLLNHDRRMMLR